jgi:hypothetical protein
MKKIIVLLFVTMICQSCYIWEEERERAEAERRQMEMMFMLGLGKTTIVDPSTGETSYVDPIGAQVGIESKIVEINQKSSLISGINLSFQGADYVDPGITGTVKLTYLNVPMLFNYDFSEKIFAEVGLQPGLLISARDKYHDQNDNYSDAIKKIEVGLPVGIGYRLNDQIDLGVRATFGLTNINSNGEGNDHNLLVVARARYTIDLSKLKK